MFLGHFAVALALKPRARRASLGTLFAAAQALDLVWPVFVLLGWESLRIVPAADPFLRLDFHSYPYSHSLLAALGWSLAVAAGYAALRHNRQVAAWLGLAVFSHWVLDWISHRPDLPLAPGLATRVGLGLWNHPAATVLVELGVFAAGAVLYLRATRARNRRGKILIWVLLGFLVVVYLANVWGPPPASARGVAWSAVAMWLLVAWAAWADQGREARVAAGVS